MTRALAERPGLGIVMAGMHILVVEDQDAIRRMIEALMSARGHVVATAPNGVRALESAFSSKPDVVLLDVNLPGTMDGLEVCRRLQADARTAGIPVIIISAMDEVETRKKAIEAGATSYFPKPFSPTALLKEIDGIESKWVKKRLSKRLRSEALADAPASPLPALDATPPQASFTPAEPAPPAKAGPSRELRAGSRNAVRARPRRSSARRARRWGCAAGRRA